MRLIRYYLDRFANPGRADFLSMGYGIEARATRCRKFWARHIEYSRDFQIKALGEIGSGSSIFVYGAGRLYDVPIKEMLATGAKLTLFDADPSVLRFWLKTARDLDAEKQIDFKLLDLTGAIDSWSQKISELLNKPKDISALCSQLYELSCIDCLPKHSADLVISINLLSQIPIYFRDRAQEMLLHKWRLDTDKQGNYEPTLQAAFNSCMQKLQQAHLKLVEQSATCAAVIISDSEFFYYKSNQSEWQAESALFIELSNEIGKLRLSGKDSWLWHIAPQGIENKDHGSIHLVKARFYRN